MSSFSATVRTMFAIRKRESGAMKPDPPNEDFDRAERERAALERIARFIETATDEELAWLRLLLEREMSSRQN
jgi:hypothetical protein